MSDQPLPEYVCHKHVRAGYIVSIELVREHEEAPDADMFKLHLSADSKVEGFAYWRLVTREWLKKHNLSPEGHGGYFVEYKDGYSSWSPTKEFVDGYTRVAE